MGSRGRPADDRAQRVVVAQGDVFWASFGDPPRPEPEARHPVVVVQDDAFNASRLRTVVVVPLTSNLRWATAPGNVALSPNSTGLPGDSVANVSQIVTVERSSLSERTGHLAEAKLELILAGIDLVLGREVA